MDMALQYNYVSSSVPKKAFKVFSILSFSNIRPSLLQETLVLCSSSFMLYILLVLVLPGLNVVSQSVCLLVWYLMCVNMSMSTFLIQIVVPKLTIFVVPIPKRKLVSFRPFVSVCHVNFKITSNKIMFSI